MTNFTQRAITGTCLVVFIVAAVWSGPYSFLFLCLLINLFGLKEFYQLSEQLHAAPEKKLGYAASSCLLVIFFAVATNLLDWQIVLLCIPVLATIFIAELYTASENPFQNIAFTSLGIIYITFPLALFNSIAFLPLPEGTYHKEIISGYFLLVWAHDTGAYLVGSAIGKHKLFPSVSPKKTWEGSAGGAACSLVTAFVNAVYFYDLTLVNWLIISILVTVIGTYGDLMKSLLKRSVNVKDSGTILPGHGGVLDRFDSLMSSAPFVFGYLAMCWK